MPWELYFAEPETPELESAGPQEKSEEINKPKKEEVDSEEYVEEPPLDQEDIFEFEQYLYVIAGFAGLIALIILAVYYKRKRR